MELVKLKQASLENLLVIGIDCPGTISLNDYKRLHGTVDLLARLIPRGGAETELPLRAACRFCTHPVPAGTDLTIGLFGLDLGVEIMIGAESQTGEEVVGALGLETSSASRRSAATSALISRRAQVSQRALREIQKTIGGVDNLKTAFASCVACHNCRRACPLCYCRECVFDSSVFDFEASKYLEWASRRAVRMPTDVLLFHLTRLNHMVSSCVGCGMCTEACPNGIAVSDIFRLVGSQVQQRLGYEPGRSLEDALPLSTFREDELGEVGS